MTQFAPFSRFDVAAPAAAAQQAWLWWRNEIPAAAQHRW